MILVHRMVCERSDRAPDCQRALRAERRLFLKRRWRGVAEDGCEFGFDLETRLKHGGVIHRTDTIDYCIWQEPEMVYVFHPGTTAEGSRIGWGIGNLHIPVEIQFDRILALHDPSVRQLGEREGWLMTEEVCLFQPLRVAAHAYKATP